jgi:hypothetical protein
MQGDRKNSMGTKRPQPLTGQGAAAPPSSVIPVSLLIEHDGFIHFDERLLDHRLRQSARLQGPALAGHSMIRPAAHLRRAQS